jgi:tetratricopeptide (TPR) repeat protein
VAIRERLAKENPAFLGDLASSLNNLGIRYNEVGRHADAVEPTERAMGIYERLAEENPAFLGDLARAFNNLGIRYGEVDRRADAVEPTERAVAIRERLAKENPAFLGDLASSLNNLGIRYGEVDRRADAVEPTERAVGIYERLAEENPAYLNDLASSLNNLGVRYSEVDNDSGGGRRWAATLEHFAKDAHASVILRLRRLRSENEFDESIEDLLQAMDLDPGDDSRLTAEVHRACRSARLKNRERFDSVWGTRTDALPDWLVVDDETMTSCVEWLNTKTWAESRDYLAAHADRLLGENGQIALAEIALAFPSNAIVGRHEALLEACRQDGIDAPYQPLLIGETVKAWRALADLEESKQFLLDHSNDLFTDVALATVERSADLEGRALLGLALAGEADFAYAILEGREPGTTALADARRHADPDRLQFIALLCFAAADDDAQRSKAAVHLAMSLAITGRGDDAAKVIHEACQASDVSTAISDLTDAIAHRTEDAASLASLIQEVNQHETPSPD